MSLLIDTNVVSYFYKKDTRAALYEPHLEGHIWAISFMTLAELRLWTLERNWSEKRRKHLAEFLEDYAVIYADDELCGIWAEIMRNARRAGKLIDTSDAWIAAVALMFDIPLVTHNRRHFENVKNLKIISES